MANLIFSVIYKNIKNMSSAAVMINTLKVNAREFDICVLYRVLRENVMHHFCTSCISWVFSLILLQYINLIQNLALFGSYKCSHLTTYQRKSRLFRELKFQDPKIPRI